MVLRQLTIEFNLCLVPCTKVEMLYSNVCLTSHSKLGSFSEYIKDTSDFRVNTEEKMAKLDST